MRPGSQFLNEKEIVLPYYIPEVKAIWEWSTEHIGLSSISCMEKQLCNIFDWICLLFRHSYTYNL